MNKYKSAWSDCFDNVEVVVEKQYSQKFDNGARILSQLVDNTEPTGPIVTRRHRSLFLICGRCRHQTVAIGNRKLSYCGNCGVKIDWSV